MTTLKQVIEYFKVKKHPKAGITAEVREAEILLHWKVLIITFSFFVLGILYSSFSFYRQVQNGEFFADVKKIVPDSKTAIFDTLDKTVGRIEARSAIFQEMRASGFRPTDPSR